MPNADVNPKPAGETENSKPGNRKTGEVAIKQPNEPGLDREANDETGEPAVKPADEVSEGR